MSRLLVTHGHHFGVCYALLEDTSLGRSSACTIQLLDEKVSRLHSTIRKDGDTYIVKDEGSSNGTGLNGRLLTEPAILSPGDEVAVGNNLMLFDPDLEVLRDLDGAGSVIIAAPGGAKVAAAAPGKPTREGGFQVEALLGVIADMLAGPRGVGRPAAMVEAAVKGLDAERGALLLAPTGGEPMRAVATYPHRGRVTISRDILHGVLEDRVPRLGDNGLIELTVKSGRSLIEAHPGGTLGVPIMLGGRVRGIFYVESARSGAFAGLPRETVQSVLAVAFAHLLSGPPELLRPTRERPEPEVPVAQSPTMQAVVEQARAAAEEAAPVLLVGEAGTGKEFLAAFIHSQGPRQTGPFVAAHCAHLPDNSAESALFGHEKGAFSGATGRRAGLIEQADGGTILIDGLAELDATLQTKLLRMVQEGRFYRVGGTRPVRVDVRIIGGSVRDLRALVGEGTFRGDLLERIDVLRINMPPLRKRIADIAPLVDRFVSRFNMRNGIRHKGFSAEALGLLEGHGWPGNVSELRDCVERLLIRAPGEYVEADEVDDELVALTATASGDADLAPDAIGALDKRIVARALARCRGNKGRTALMLRVPRGRLDRLIALYDLDVYGR